MKSRFIHAQTTESSGRWPYRTKLYRWWFHITVPLEGKKYVHVSINLVAILQCQMLDMGMLYHDEYPSAPATAFPAAYAPTSMPPTTPITPTAVAVLETWNTIRIYFSTFLHNCAFSLNFLYNISSMLLLLWWEHLCLDKASLHLAFFLVTETDVRVRALMSQVLHPDYHAHGKTANRRAYLSRSFLSVSAEVRKVLAIIRRQVVASFADLYANIVLNELYLTI